MKYSIAVFSACMYISTSCQAALLAPFNQLDLYDGTLDSSGLLENCTGPSLSLCIWLQLPWDNYWDNGGGLAPTPPSTGSDPDAFISWEAGGVGTGIFANIYSSPGFGGIVGGAVPTAIIDDTAGTVVADFSSLIMNFNGIDANVGGTATGTVNSLSGGIADITLSWSTIIVGGPLAGENLSFTVSGTTAVSTVPVPAAVWLFGSGLLGLVGVGGRKKAA